MPIHIIDSQIYGAAWGTAARRASFDNRPQGWLEMIIPAFHAPFVMVENAPIEENLILNHL